MVASSIFDEGNHLYFCLPPVILSTVLQSIFSSDILKDYYLLVLYFCACFFMVCCLVTLSRPFELRRKPKAVTKPIARLYDSDLESDDDLGVLQRKGTNPQLILLENFFHFCSSRRIYGLVAGVGASFGIPLLYLSVVMPPKEAGVSKDYESAFIVLAFALVFLELLVLVVANTSKWEDSKSAVTPYKPFDEFIRVPMKVFVPKIIGLQFLNGRTFFYLATNLFCQLAAFYGFISVDLMTEEQIRRLEEATKMKGIHSVLLIAMVIANVNFLLILFNLLYMTWKSTKKSLLLTFEKNWERNLMALEFLLPEKDVATLEELRDAVREKSRQEQLTEVEKKALLYVGRPLWRSKRAFLGKSKKAGRRPEISMNASTKNTHKEVPNGVCSLIQDDQPSSLNISSQVTRCRSHLM